MGGTLDNSAASTPTVGYIRFLLHILSEGTTATSPDVSWTTLPYSVGAAVEHACCTLSLLMTIKEKHERDEGVCSIALNKSKNIVERRRHVTLAFNRSTGFRIPITRLLYARRKAAQQHGTAPSTIVQLQDTPKQQSCNSSAKQRKNNTRTTTEQCTLSRFRQEAKTT